QPSTISHQDLATLPALPSPAGGGPDKIGTMRQGAPALVLTLSATLVAGLVAGLRAGVVPLGVRGAWEWLRVPYGPAALDLFLAAAAVALYAAFAATVRKALETKPTPLREASAVVALLGASVAVQAVAQTGAPVGYGLAKWVIALHGKGSSG